MSLDNVVMSQRVPEEKEHDERENFGEHEVDVVIFLICGIACLHSGFIRCIRS